MNKRTINPGVFILLIGVILLALLISRVSASRPLPDDKLQQPSSSLIISANITSTASTDDDEASYSKNSSLPTEQPQTESTSQAGDASIGSTATPPVYSPSDLIAANSQGAVNSAQPQALTDSQTDWNPPSLPVPLARHPFDHFWFVRPVASSHINYGLDWYGYGSNGPNNDIRVHHGIDLANPVGVEVVAVADGIVEWVGKGHHNELEDISVYGNTVVIRHDTGYNGKPIWTLYAHLSALLAQQDERVSAGDVIGLIGATGQVSGPHVHFEIRLEQNGYYHVRNPDLWLAPYVGTGVIAGRVEYPDGSLANDADVLVIDVETSEIIRRVTTYAGFGVNSDDAWRENFTIPDFPTGSYLVTASKDGTRWTGEVIVREGMTNWVDLEHFQAELTPTPSASITPTPLP